MQIKNAFLQVAELSAQMLSTAQAISKETLLVTHFSKNQRNSPL
jgi:hypothetical protein